MTIAETKRNSSCLKIFLACALLSSPLFSSFASAACTHEYGQATYDDIREKFAGDEASGGSSYAKGARANGLHIYIDPTVEEIEETAKVSVHEYIHLLQQGYLNKELTQYSAPVGGEPIADTSIGNGARFQSINLCGVAEATVAAHLASLNAMPDAIKLFDHPTFVIFYSQTPGEGTGSCDASQTETFARTAFNIIYGEDCPGMESTPMVWEANENHVFAEGEAEYWATNKYTGSYTSFDGPTYWTDKLADAKNYCNLPGNSNFYINSGSSQDVDEMKDKMQAAGVSPACSNNAIGELVYAYFIQLCLETDAGALNDDGMCNHESLRRVWKYAPTYGFDCAFFNQYGWTWGELVAKMYVEYQVDTSEVATNVPSLCLYDQTCSGEPKPCNRLPSYTKNEAENFCQLPIDAACGSSSSSSSSLSSSSSSPTKMYSFANVVISSVIAASVTFYFAFFLN